MSRPSAPVYILDGSTYIFRAYHAIAHLSKKDGTPTNAVFGVANMLLRFLRENRPEYFIVVFDAGGTSFRKDLYKDYKANRPPAPEDLLPQFALVRQAVDALGIPRIEMPNYEADDIIATYAEHARREKHPVIIVSSDKDLMQLIGEQVTMIDPMKDHKLYDRAAVEEKWGVGPEKMVDLQALVGDTSDNVPGVPKIGPKTAADLIGRFGSLDNLYAHLDDLKPGKIKENLIQYKEQAYLSRDLVRLKSDLDIPFDLGRFTLPAFDAGKAAAFFKEMEFNRLAEALEAPTPAAAKADSPASAPQSEAAYHLVNEPDALRRLVSQLEKQERFAFDLETTSLDAVRARIVGLSFSWKAGEGYYIPVGHRVLGAQQIPQVEVFKALRPVLESPNSTKIGQNIKYDITVAAHNGLPVNGPLEDTMICSYLLDSARNSHGMDALAEEFLGYKTLKYEEVTGKGKKQLGFDEVDIETACRYSAEDAEVTWRLWQVFDPMIRDAGLRDIYEKIEGPLIRVLARMESAGVLVDAVYLRKLSTDYEKRLQALEKEIHQLADGSFNINSPQQLGTILFEKLNLPTGRKTKTSYSTDVDVLTKLSSLHPLPAKVLEFRQLGKLKSTYSDALVTAINPETGRVHTSFNQTVAATGRLSSTDPNLQNIPIRTDEGRKIRKAFIAPPGHLLVSADYSQIELRIMAHLSGEPAWIEGFQTDLDIHRLTAAEVWGVPPEQVTSDMRSRAKAINFGILYGMSAFGLSEALGIDRGEAAEFIDRYFTRYSRVKAALDRFIAEARQQGYVSTLGGRKCHIPNIHAKNHNVVQQAERNAVNYPIQGSAADIIKIAMNRLDARITRDRLPMTLVLQVHDELVAEVEASRWEECATAMREEMEGAMQLSVPLTVSVGHGPNWDEAH